jgi:hypothetical protein
MTYKFKICSASSKLERVESQPIHLAFLDVSRVRVLVCKGFKGHYELIHLKSLVDFGVPNAMGEGPIILVNTKSLILYSGQKSGLKCNKTNINKVCSFRFI